MRSPGSSPQDQPVPPHHGASERAPAPREPEPAGSLPPPAMIGLDIGHGPDIDRKWVPPADELDPSASLPDRPPSTLAERAPVLLAVAVGFILMAVAIVLLWRSSMGNPAEPTVGPPGGGQQPGGALASPLPSPGFVDTTSPQPATPASAQRLETPSPVVQPEPTPATITIAVSASAATIHGLTAEAAAQALRDALTSLVPGQRVQLATAPGQATIAIVQNAPPGYRSYVIAAAPLAVVTSPRLALTGVSRDQAERLLRGEIRDWFSAGAGITLKVEPLALSSAPLAGAQPVATYDSYDALVAGFTDHPGGVALVPLSEVDWRVNVLAVDGIDLLESQGDLSAYPFGQRLVAAIRADQPQDVHRAVAQAFAKLGWPHAMPALTRVGIAGDLSPVSGASPGMLADIARLVSAFDLAAISLDGHATSPGQGGTPSPPLASGDLAVELARAGIDAVSLAALSSQEAKAALPELLGALHDAGLATTGAGMTEAEAREPLIVERNGVRVAIVAAHTGPVPSTSTTATAPRPNRVTPSALAEDVRRAAAQADIVLVLLYHGEEGAATPDSDLIAATHLAIDAGAEAVIVSDPAGIGGLALYKDRPILFGIGAVTGNPAAVELRQSAIAELVFDGDTLIRLRLHGIESGPAGSPRLMSGDEQAALLDRFWRLSPMPADQSR